MKKLNIRSFGIIMSGIISATIVQIYSLFAKRYRKFTFLKKRFDEEALERFAVRLFRLNFIFVIVFLIVSIYLVYRLIKNLREKQGQKYITFLFCISIISLFLCLIQLIFRNWVTLVVIVIDVVIIVGCSIQKAVSVENDA